MISGSARNRAAPAARRADERGGPPEHRGGHRRASSLMSNAGCGGGARDRAALAHRPRVRALRPGQQRRRRFRRCKRTRRRRLAGPRRPARLRGSASPGMPRTMPRAGVGRSRRSAPRRSRTPNWWSTRCSAPASAGPSSGEVIPALAAAAERRVPVVAIDVPSGVMGDTGESFGAIPAACTVTFTRKKPAHVLLPGRDLCGDLVVADIGTPPEVLSGIGVDTWENHPAAVAGRIPAPESRGNKYGRGHALLFGGYPMTGAAQHGRARRGARRGGADHHRSSGGGAAHLRRRAHQHHGAPPVRSRRFIDVARRRALQRVHDRSRRRDQRDHPQRRACHAGDAPGRPARRRRAHGVCRPYRRHERGHPRPVRSHPARGRVRAAVRFCGRQAVAGAGRRAQQRRRRWY